MTLKVYSVRFSSEEIKRLKDAKWDLRMSVNQIVRNAVNEYLDRGYKKLKKGKK